jgi:hypothetical protein
MDISNFKRDVVASEGGKWVGDIPGFGDVRLKVRGLGSKHYTEAVARLSRAAPPEDRLADRSLKPEATFRIMGQAMHEAILLDWDGLSDGGKALPFDKALALVWLTDPEFRPFLDAVTWAATVVENGRADAGKELEKN